MNKGCVGVSYTEEEQVKVFDERDRWSQEGVEMESRLECIVIASRA